MKLRLSFFAVSSACSTLLLACPALAERFVATGGFDLAAVGMPGLNDCTNISIQRGISRDEHCDVGAVEFIP
jgi:hypothetical protein